MSNKLKIILAIAFMLFVITLDILFAKCTDSLIDETEKKLENLEIALISEDYEESKIKSKELDEKWNYVENKFSYFIEHDELEKVSAKVAIILENSKNSEYTVALEDVAETKFLLDHIKDKLKLTLKNVF